MYLAVTFRSPEIYVDPHVHEIYVYTWHHCSSRLRSPHPPATVTHVYLSSKHVIKCTGAKAKVWPQTHTFHQVNSIARAHVPADLYLIC